MFKQILRLLASFFLIANVQSQFNGFRPQQCRASTGEIGVCYPFSQCRSVQATYRFVSPVICSYNRRDPIVCCPQGRGNGGGGGGVGGGQTGGNLVNGRISERKCRERYSQSGGVRAKRDFHTTIVGGVPTTRGEFPHMAAIGWTSADGTTSYNCGGFLVDYNYVVTAAHCTNVFGSAPNTVRLGGGNIDLAGNDIPINGIIVHPGYRAGTQYNDIAILRLASSANELPACLWPSYNINFAEGTAIGYGHTQFAGQRSSTLLKVNLNIFSNQECSGYYPPSQELRNGIIDSQLCVGDPNRAKDTCQGDSGGPVVVKSNDNGRTIPYVIGITSFGQGCAGEAPSIYTRISSYLDFIESVVWRNEN